MVEPLILTETEDYFVLNKPAGMAVEPPSRTETLQDWLLKSGKIEKGEWGPEDRWGVVHRLDTDTSGVMVWAKNRAAQIDLRTQWQGRQVEKTYLALVVGETPKEGSIELAIERDNKHDRQKVALLPSPRSRPAITHYKRLTTGEVAGEKVSLVECHPITGRTHQLRVHLKAIGHPIIGDGLYGEKKTDQIAKVIGLARQFLHASRLCLPDPSEHRCFEAPLPEDLQTALQKSNANP
jgi:23S rRNA pseudouridine1911/1915/1917 synthase